MDLILQVFGIGIVIAIIHIILDNMGKKDIAIVIDMLGLVMILLLVVKEVMDLIYTVTTMFGL